MGVLEVTLNATFDAVGWPFSGTWDAWSRWGHLSSFRQHRWGQLCVCVFFFFNCCVFCSSSLCFLPLFATQHTWWNPASLHDTGWWRAGSLESKGDSGIHHGEKVPSEKNNRKTCEELCHHTKNDMGKKVRKPEFPGTEWFCIPLDNNSTLNLDTRGLDQHVRVV